MSVYELTTEFRQYMAAYQLEVDGGIVPDGEIHRFSDGGRNNKDGWYVFFLDGNHAGGAFGNWKGIDEKWSSRSVSNLSKTDFEAFQKRVKAQRSEAEEKRKQTANLAEIEANRLWGEAVKTDTHPYLEEKGIKGHSLKYHYGEKCLLVPLYKSSTEICNLQRIYDDGSKRFLPDGAIIGNASVIIGNHAVVYVCEGYATAETIHNATGNTVFAAMNAGNILAVAKKIREKSPSQKIIIAADDDYETIDNKGNLYNVGVEKGKAAAEKVGGCFVFPVFNNRPEGSKLTDFNDLAAIDGIEEVKRQLESVLQRRKKEVFDIVSKWALQSPGNFTTLELDRDLGIISNEDKKYRTEALAELCKSGRVAKDGSKKTSYRTRDFQPSILNVFDGEKESLLKIGLPFGLDDIVSFSKRNVIIYAGETNAGKTTLALQTLLNTRNKYNSKGWEFFYLTSEMSKQEAEWAMSRVAPKEQWEGVEIHDRQFEPYDLIYGNKSMRNGFVVIDFLEARDGAYNKVVSEIQQVYDAMESGIALILLQKPKGREFGKGGEGTKEKARFYLNLDKVFGSDFGSVCLASVAKSKHTWEGQINPEGKSMFYSIGKNRWEGIGSWSYMNEEGIKKNTKQLKDVFGVKESEDIEFDNLAIQRCMRDNG